MTIERLDGWRVPLVVNIAPIRDQFGTIVGEVNFFEDITEWKRRAAEREHLPMEVASSAEGLRSVREPLEAKIEERTAFLGKESMKSQHLTPQQPLQRSRNPEPDLSKREYPYAREHRSAGPVADLFAIAAENTLRHQRLTGSSKGTTQRRERNFGEIVGTSARITSGQNAMT